MVEGMNDCLQAAVEDDGTDDEEGLRQSECQAQAIIMLTMDDGPPSLPPSGAPTSTRERCIADTLSAQSYFTDAMEARMRDPSTPQNRALQWVADTDPQAIACTDDLNLKFRYALATFYFSTGGPNWNLSLNWLSDAHICHWWDVADDGETPLGIYCRVDQDAQSVDAFLHLTDNNLVGTIPEETVLIQELFSVALSDNHLTGTLPDTLVPQLPKLFELLLDNNSLHGSIPDTYGDSSTLKVFYLHNNALMGTIPGSLADNGALAWLNLGFNRLDGGVPKSFRNHSSLVRLLMSSNRLEGDLEETIDEALPRALQYLWLGSNQFNGTIPSLLGDEFTDILSLDLRNNLRLDPSVIPTSFNKWQRLWQLTLNSCNLIGPIPFDKPLGFPELEWIQFVENQLTGTIPPALLSSPLLQKLLLSKNELRGTIPTEIGRLSMLLELALGFNQFSGPLPTELGLLTRLDAFGASENQLTGGLPTEMGLLKQLRLLSIRDNQLNGPLPRQLGKLRRLRNLILDGNQFTRTVPVSFAKLKRLDYLDLSENEIVGNITFVCEAVPTIENFAADCFGAGSEVICGCCNICCDAFGRCFSN